MVHDMHLVDVRGRKRDDRALAIQMKQRADGFMNLAAIHHAATGKDE